MASLTFINTKSKRQYKLTDDFGFVLTNKNTGNYTTETKEYETFSWKDIDGEDVYIPEDQTKVAAYDIEFHAACNNSDGTNVKTKYLALRDMLITGHHTDLAGGMSAMYDIVSSYEGLIYNKCYLKSISTENYFNDGRNQILEIKLTFRVTSPRNHSTLEYN